VRVSWIMIDEELQNEVDDVEAVPIEEPKPEHKPKSEISQRLVNQTKKIGGAFKTERLKSFWQECKRVLRVTKKPDKQEFMTIVKISSMGMGVVGIVGFLIHFAFSEFENGRAEFRTKITGNRRCGGCTCCRGNQKDS